MARNIVSCNNEQRKIDIVYKYLWENIISGNVKPGERIILREIANKLNVSEMPVREALQLLSANGLIEIKPYIGAIVTTPSIDDLEEVLIVRAFLESFAVLTSAPRLSEIDILELVECYEMMGICQKRNDYLSYSVHDRKFHSLLVKNTYKTLHEILEQLTIKSEWARAIFKIQPSSISDSYNEHTVMFKALQNKDYEKLAEALKQHRLRVGKEIKQSYSEKD